MSDVNINGLCVILRVMNGDCPFDNHLKLLTGMSSFNVNNKRRTGLG